MRQSGIEQAPAGWQLRIRRGENYLDDAAARPSAGHIVRRHVDPCRAEVHPAVATVVGRNADVPAAHRHQRLDYPVGGIARQADAEHRRRAVGVVRGAGNAVLAAFVVRHDEGEGHVAARTAAEHEEVESPCMAARDHVRHHHRAGDRVAGVFQSRPQRGGIRDRERPVGVAFACRQAGTQPVPGHRLRSCKGGEQDVGAVGQRDEAEQGRAMAGIQIGPLEDREAEGGEVGGGLFEVVHQQHHVVETQIQARCPSVMSIILRSRARAGRAAG